MILPPEIHGGLSFTCLFNMLLSYNWVSVTVGTAGSYGQKSLASDMLGSQ